MTKFAWTYDTFDIFFAIYDYLSYIPIDKIWNYDKINSLLKYLNVFVGGRYENGFAKRRKICY